MNESWKVVASGAMDRYARGDDSAFSELYDALAPRLSSFLLRRTRDATRTEDLLQQTFLQMHCARRHFAPGASATSWAFAIARNLLVDTYRKSAHEIVADEDEQRHQERECVAPGASPEAIAHQRQLVRRMQEQLARVPEAHRAAFELVQRDGLSMAEAAEVLGTTVAAVKLRAFRAYEALRATIGEELREELEGAL
jgi:RNA polymerase sigma-70 factor, ECF subfamily